MYVYVYVQCACKVRREVDVVRLALPAVELRANGAGAEGEGEGEGKESVGATPSSLIPQLPTAPPPHPTTLFVAHLLSPGPMPLHSCAGFHPRGLHAERVLLRNPA